MYDDEGFVLKIQLKISFLLLLKKLKNPLYSFQDYFQRFCLEIPAENFKISQKKGIKHEFSSWSEGFNFVSLSFRTKYLLSKNF